MADFVATQGDTATTIKDTLIGPDGTVQDLTGAAVVLAIAFPHATVRRAATVNTPATAGIVQYELVAGDYQYPGTWRCKWEATFAGGSVESYPDDRYMRIRIGRNL